ncbi:MAG: hypothetical protein Q9225_000219 [Loekoesia sp. 1 TL-2023]
MKLTEIKEKMGSLERVLEQDVARKGERQRTWKVDPEGEQIDFAPEPEDEKDLEPTPLALSDAVYDDEADDDLADLGFAMGRMRLSDRIGGFFRPKMAEEMTASLNEENGDQRSSPQKPLSPEQPIPHFVPKPTYSKFLAPGPTYIAPSSSFFFSSGQNSASLIDFLPSKLIADRLLNQYWLAVHPLCRTVHRPSFQRRYRAFWADVETGIEPPGSLQAVVFAALFSGVVSMSDNAVLMEFGTTKKDLVDNFQMGTETALGRANVIRTTKVETLQALVMYMICFLDIRTCEAQGPRPYIRADEFDTELPLNVDDEELESRDPPTASVPKWTDMTLSLIRMEGNEMFRVVWVDRPRLEKKMISLTAVLGKIENFRKTMKDKYLCFIDDNVPVQHLGRQVCEIMYLRMHIMVLHRTDRLRQIIINSGTEIMERAIQIETAPALSPWAWYSSAIQQYHTALLLLMEIFANPQRKEADRIWRCLDYVFEIPPHIPKDQKGRWVMTEIRDKMGIYIASRKVMAPSSMLERIGSQSPRNTSGTGNSPTPSVGKVSQNSADFAHGYTPATSQPYAQGSVTFKQYPMAMSGAEPQVAMAMPAPPAQPDIDWHEWDKLFPPDVHTNYMTSTG